MGLSPYDAVTITRLDTLIKKRKEEYKILDIDRNGTILLRDSSGRELRYSEKLISTEREMIKNFSSEDAHDLGYRVGFRDGFNVKKYKKHLAINIKNKLINLVPFIKL